MVIFWIYLAIAVLWSVWVHNMVKNDMDVLDRIYYDTNLTVRIRHHICTLLVGVFWPVVVAVFFWQQLKGAVYK